MADAPSPAAAPGSLAAGLATGGSSSAGSPAAGATVDSGGGDAAIASIAALLAALEELSRQRPDRVLRLRGQLPPGSGGEADGGLAPGSEGPAGEPFELLIFRGFSSLTTHPTGFDPDRAALPEGTELGSAELLAAPLNPAAERVLAGPAPVASFLEAAAWG